MKDSIVILFYSDVDRILRSLYKGSRPIRIHFLICSCGRVANLTQSDAEAIGWQILPYPECPGCRQHEPYQGPARERYLALVEQLISRKEGV
jgi:hypothetical protein